MDVQLSNNFQIFNANEVNTQSVKEKNNSDSDNSPMKPGSQYKILVVEDNLVNQKIIRFMLEDIGYHVDIAPCGTDALAMYNDSYDLILLDIGLPDTDGYEVSKTIRHQNKVVPILAFTAFLSREIQHKCQAAGIDSILEKPVISRNMQAMLQKYLNNPLAVED